MPPRFRNNEMAAAAVAALVVATTALYWYRRNRRDYSRQEDRAVPATEASTEPAPFINSINKSGVDPSIWRSFEEAAHRIRTDKKLNLKNGDKLMLYGLFKHIVSGDAPAKMSLNGSRALNIVVEQAKHSAWAKMRGIPVAMAMTHYLAAVQHFVEASAAASTTGGEAEESSEEDLTGVMGPGVVSRPAIDNGGIIDGDDGEDNDVQLRLLRAAGKNDLTALIELLTNEPTVNVNHQDESGQTALHLAADKGSVECCIALIEAGSNVNSADHDGISVLQAAVIAGNVRVCKILLDYGADTDQADVDGDTPRSCAMEDGGAAMLRIFSQSAIPTIQEESDDE